VRAGVRTVIAVILGNILYALTVQLFLEPAGLPTGGTTGIALFVRAFTGIPISAFVLLFNTAMLLWGWRVLGRKFFFATVLSSLVYPVSLAALERLLSGVALTDSVMLNTIFSGLGIGASLGIVIREGASTGGCDIPPLILHKKTGISVSGILSGMDYGILLLQAFSNPPEKILYGFLVILLYSLTMDRILLSGAQKTEVRIVSRHADEIRKEILTEVDRGVTVLAGAGGFTGEEETLLLSVISNRELPAVEKIIRAVDPEAFVVISRVAEVSGRGFTMKKRYLDAMTQEDRERGEETG
jgi:uncharacterized membrane-anchored protein YitT (DUF2179 family)